MSLRSYAFLVGITGGALLAGPRLESATEHLTPKYRPDPSLQPILANVHPGGDAFPLEKTAEELTARLSELGARLRAGAPDGASRLLSASFSGRSLRPQHETAVSGAA